MSKFECTVYQVTIKSHPNADAIELAQIGDYVSIVKKGMFNQNDLVVYIPEGAVVPQYMLQRIGLWDDEKQVGKLAGKTGNRVKSIKLRGVLSTGLIYPVEFRPDCYCTNTDSPKEHIKDIHCVTREEGDAGHMVEIGTDVTEYLGITKYEPVIPSSMSGEVFNAFGMTMKFDIENIKKFPDVLRECENVQFTEKLHGTWACFGYHPNCDHPIITSKGLSDKGLAFKYNEENMKRNLYVKTYDGITSEDKWLSILDMFLDAHIAGGLEDWEEEEGNLPFYILGEIFGAGVQDLTYGNLPTQFRIFDIYVGEPGKGEYLDFDTVETICRFMQIPYVPALYYGPFHKEILDKFTNGAETVSGTEAHVREGIVVRVKEERRNDEIGRVILKSVSEKYLLRRNATEYT